MQKNFNRNELNKPYIYEDKKKEVYKVNANALAKFIRENETIYFIHGTQMIMIYENGVYVKTDEPGMKRRIAKYIPEELTSSWNVSEAFKILAMECEEKLYSEFDTKQSVINFRNGILNVNTLALSPHTADLLSTIQIPCDWVENAVKPDHSVYEDYINHLTDYNLELRETIEQFMGVALSNVHGYKGKKALLLYGTHDTGKSQLRTLIAKLVGLENNSPADLSTIEHRFGTSMIYDKRVVGSADMGYANVKEMAVIKQLTGGDEINVERKGKDSFPAIFKGVLWFCCNQLPKFGGDQGKGVYNRFIIVPCNNPVEKKDPQLQSKLIKEREYIVSKAVHALRRFVNNNFTYSEPDVVIEQREEYKTENNSFRMFLSECCKKRIDHKIDDSCTRPKFNNIYREWCRVNGYKAENDSNIKKILKELNLDGTKKIKGIIYYSDITLSTDTKYEFVFYYNEYDLRQETLEPDPELNPFTSTTQIDSKQIGFRM